MTVFGGAGISAPPNTDVIIDDQQVGDGPSVRSTGSGVVGVLHYVEVRKAPPVHRDLELIIR